jgi:hypothetical protein
MLCRWVRHYSSKKPSFIIKRHNCLTLTDDLNDPWHPSWPECSAVPPQHLQSHAESVHCTVNAT